MCHKSTGIHLRKKLKNIRKNKMLKAVLVKINKVVVECGNKEITLMILEQEAQEAQENPELEPMKKYLLLQKLEHLKDKMTQNEINASSLDTFLKFGKNLSYDTIVSVSDSMLTFLEKQFGNNLNSQGDNNAESTKEQ